MSAIDIVAVTRALDAIPDLDHATTDERVACARRIMEKAPSVLVADLVDRIQYASSRLANLVRNESNVTTARRLAYVGSIAVNGTGQAPEAQPPGDEDPRRAERNFHKYEAEEMARTDAAWRASRAERHARPQQPDYAPPSVVARAFENAKASFKARPSWAGPPSKGTPPKWQPSGIPNADADDAAPRVRGGLATMATALDVDEMNSAERDE